MKLSLFKNLVSNSFGMVDLSRLRYFHIFKFPFVFLIFCYLMWSSVIAGIASFDVVFSERKLSKWSSQNRAGEKELSSVEASINSVIELQPNNAHAYLLRGKLSEWLAFINPEQKERYLDSSLDDIKSSIRVRPNWPNAWLELAVIKHYLGHYDSEYENALFKAAELGPYKQDVTLGLVNLGFATWHVNNSSMKLSLIDALKRALTNAATGWKVVEIAKEHGQMAIVCTVYRSVSRTSSLPLLIEECT